MAQSLLRVIDKGRICLNIVQPNKEVLQTKGEILWVAIKIYLQSLH